MSVFNNGEIDEESFAQQLLEDAPRSWLFNRRQEGANAMFAAEIEAAREVNRQRHRAAYEAQLEVERHIVERAKVTKR